MATAARREPREPSPSTGRGSGAEPATPHRAPVAGRERSPGTPSLSSGGTRDSPSRSAVPVQGSGGTFPSLDRRRTPGPAPASPPVSSKCKDTSKPGIWGVAAAQLLLWLQPRSPLPLPLQNDPWHFTILIKTPEISSKRIKHQDKTQAEARTQKAPLKKFPLN